LFDQLDEEFHFSIDACASADNALCPRFWSAADDGLRQDWSGETPWWNCPFDDAGAWVRKAFNESKNGVTSVGLVPTRKQEYWFRLACENAQMRLVQGGRLFFAGNGDQQGRLARVDCTIFVFGPGFQGNTIGPFIVPPWPNKTPPRLSGIRSYATELAKPDGTVVIRTFAELVPHIKAFATGALEFLVLLGRPGLAKSTLFRSHMPAESLWVKGNASPFKTYYRGFQFRNQPIIFEDADPFLRTPAGIILLQQFTEHEGEKHPSWDTDSQRLVKLGIPNEYVTSSKVALLTNNWAKLKAMLIALEDRGIILAFEPSAEEVHQQVVREGWFRDLEILEFIGANLHLNLVPTMRFYTKASQLKVAGLDWRGYLRNQWLTDETLVHVATLLGDNSLPTTRAKAQAFVDCGFGSRSTFFSKAKLLRAASAPPTSVVQKSSVFQNMHLGTIQ
jgi:hypothetical protein